MSFLNRLFGRNRSTIFTQEELVRETVCPNCWGREFYDGKYQTYAENATKGKINQDLSQQKAFISQFVETKVTGIRLKSEGDRQVCPRCYKKYKQVSAKAN